MALHVRKEDEQTQFQSKVAADLRARAVATQKTHDDASEATMLNDQHQTRPAGLLVIIILATVFIAGAIYLVAQFQQSP
jgi:hypothetical protein